MRLFLFCFALGVAATHAEPGGAAPAPTIALFTQYQAEPPRAVAESLRDELDTIMAPVELRFDWRSLDAVRAKETFTEIVVVTFNGDCDPAEPVLRSKSEIALGFTHISDGQILPFTVVYCDRVRSFLQRELSALTASERETALGRALGRVLAHELYHIFAKTLRHGAGVSKEGYTVEDLVTEDFHFRQEEALNLRAWKERLHVQNPPPGL